jgi:hypothetical protein
MSRGATHGSLEGTKSVLVRLKQEYYDRLAVRAKANRRSLGGEGAKLIERALRIEQLVEESLEDADRALREEKLERVDLGLEREEKLLED